MQEAGQVGVVIARRRDVHRRLPRERAQAASAFDDEPFLSSLAATLQFAAFPSRQTGRLKYCASNQVGDAALLYAATLGPLWKKFQNRPNL